MDRTKRYFGDGLDDSWSAFAQISAKRLNKKIADSHKETIDSIIILDEIEATHNKETEKHEVKWDNMEKLTIEGVPIRFPFKPYPCQIQLMSKVLKAIKSPNKEHALLESPTGTGKTMSLLCSVLAWLEAVKSSVNVKEEKVISPDELVIHDEFELETGKVQNWDVKPDLETVGPGNIPKIFFASRTHKQLSQVVRELRRSSYDPRYCVLASRQHYCINDRVRKAKDMNDACFESMTDENKRCKFLNKLEKFMLENSKKIISKSVEELVNLGKDHTFCPYYASRELAETLAEIVFCPFDYIINPSIREVMGVEIDNSIVILDEAHNIEDVCRDAGGVELNNGQLFAIMNELSLFTDGISGNPRDDVELPMEHMTQLATVTVIHHWLTDSPWKHPPRDFEKDVEIFEDQDIIRTLQKMNITRETVTMWWSQLKRIDEARKQLKDTPNDFGDEGANRPKILSQGSSRLLGALYRTLSFIFKNNQEHLPSYRLVRHREYKISDQGKSAIFTLGIWCLNPAVVFNEITNKARSVILTSGTLSPMETFSSELGTKFEHRLEALHVIPADQIWVGAISLGPKGCDLKGTFKELETFAFQDDIAESILEIAKVIPDGLLCFLPSYSFMAKLVKRMEDTGMYTALRKVKKIFVEPRQGTTADFEAMMRQYYSTISGGKGAIFFAVFRGKVSEGLDFADENARAVISIGIPFPALKDEKVIQKRLYNDHHSRTKNLLPGAQWYDKQAYRALNQALGRCIRHQNDWGAIIMLERRFHNASNINGLSKWLRPRLQKFEKFQTARTSIMEYIKRMESRSADMQKIDLPSSQSDDLVIYGDEIW